MRAIRFLHTADLQLGAGFGWLPPAVADTLRRQQRTCLDAIVELAVARRADLFLVAGDLFARPDPAAADLWCVKRACERLIANGVRPVMIAGDCDPATAESVWNSETFAAGTSLLLDQPFAAVELDELSLTIVGISFSPDSADAYRLRRFGFATGLPRSILLFHGTHVAPDYAGDTLQPFTTRDLESLGMDYVALGHRHQPGELVPNRAVYSGSPVPLSFAADDRGSRRFVWGEIDERGGVQIEFCPAERMQTAVEELDVTGYSAADLADWLQARADEKLLLRVVCVGEAEGMVERDLHELERRLQPHFAHLEIDTGGLTAAFPAIGGGFQTVLGRFLQRMQVRIAAADGDDREVLQRALRLGTAALQLDQEEAGARP